MENEKLVYKIDESEVFKITQPSSIYFNLENEVAGRLFLKDGKLHFEGDLDASAEALYSMVCMTFNKKK